MTSANLVLCILEFSDPGPLKGDFPAENSVGKGCWLVLPCLNGSLYILLQDTGFLLVQWMLVAACGSIALQRVSQAVMEERRRWSI